MMRRKGRSLAIRLGLIRLVEVRVPIVVMPDHAPRVTIEDVHILPDPREGWLTVSYRCRPLPSPDSVRGWAARVDR